ncbi:signal peptidase II [Janibacter sp. YB324]|nr:signal peptidase II [Janibacter sp. YB324]
MLRWYVIAAVVTLVLDQATKVWALGALTDGRVVPLVGDLLSLRLIRNSGAAFSIGDDMTWVMTLVAVGVTLAILWAALRVGSGRWALSLGLLLGGSLGNLYDRFFRDPAPLHGHVVDFIDYGGLFVGNIADIAIVGGAAVLVWLTFANIGLDGSRPQHAAGRHDDEEQADE